MPWQSNQGGGGWQGGGGGRGPWGQGPMGGGQQPPNLEDILKQGQERVRRLMPGGGSGIGLLVVLVVVVAIWLASGFYRVGTDEQGVELWFGEWTETKPSGLRYHWPYPFETALTPKVTKVNRIDVGFRGGDDLGRSAARRNLQEEGLMLTGDENIVDVNFTVFWKIDDAGKYLFNVDQPDQTIKAVAESAMREVIGQTPIQAALTEGKKVIEDRTQDGIQAVLDSYGAGIEVTEVKMQRVDPPAAVIDAFRDVQAAEADRVRLKNEAEAYANDIIPRARGESARMVQEAEAYKQQKIAESEGEAARFLSIYNEFKLAPDVTSRRLYLETMEEVLHGMDKVILDTGAGGSGVVPYLPLNELRRQAGQGARQ